MSILDSVVGLAREARLSLLGGVGTRDQVAGAEHSTSPQDPTEDVDGDWQIVDAETLACFAEAQALLVEGIEQQPAGGPTTVHLEVVTALPSAPPLHLGADGLEYEDDESMHMLNERPVSYYSDECSDGYDEDIALEEEEEEVDVPMAPVAWGNKLTFRDVLLKNQQQQPPRPGADCGVAGSALPTLKARLVHDAAQSSAPGRGGRRNELTYGARTHADGHDVVENYYLCKQSRGVARVRAIHRLPHFIAEKKKQRIQAKAASQAR